MKPPRLQTRPLWLPAGGSTTENSMTFRQHAFIGSVRFGFRPLNQQVTAVDASRRSRRVNNNRSKLREGQENPQSLLLAARGLHSESWPCHSTCADTNANRIRSLLCRQRPCPRPDQLQAGTNCDCSDYGFEFSRWYSSRQHASN